VLGRDTPDVPRLEEIASAVLVAGLPRLPASERDVTFAGAMQHPFHIPFFGSQTCSACKLKLYIGSPPKFFHNLARASPRANKTLPNKAGRAPISGS
jgi:hypothetical protein